MTRDPNEQAAIERAAKKFAPKGGIAKLKEQIVARIDELGGIDRKPTETFEEYVPRLRAVNDE